MPDPDFSRGKKLARYIGKDWRQPNGHPVPLAFRKVRPSDTLSVNTRTIETERRIAAAYAGKWESGERPVAMTVCNVEKYVDAAKVAGAELTEVPAEKNWSFQDGGDTQPGFSHKPKDWSKSHCECDFTASFTESQDFKFAGRMAFCTTYKMR